MSVRSPSGVSADSTASTPFETGRLSPVSADSAISSVAADSRRPSAGTTSPASIETTSPGTSSLGRDLHELAVAAHARLDDHHLLQRRDRLRRLALLAQAEHGVEQRQEEQDEPGAELLQRVEAADPGDEQDDLHRVAVLAHEGAPARLDRGLGELVRPDRCQPRRGLGGREAARGVDAEPAADLVGRERVPRDRPLGAGRAGAPSVVAMSRSPSWFLRRSWCSARRRDLEPGRIERDDRCPASPRSSAGVSVDRADRGQAARLLDERAGGAHLRPHRARRELRSRPAPPASPAGSRAARACPSRRRRRRRR